ncbi:AAA family ATPase [bacterium]|nr:AAA family ATPase [bacterium]
MRIKSLKVENFYILKDFQIDFNNNLSVLIGENGSGKSTILELIADIFGHLYNYFVLGDKKTGVINDYQIHYEINDFDVFIESSSFQSNTFQPNIKINGENLSIFQIKTRYGNLKNFLPEKVVLSYSGITERLKNLSDQFEKEFIRKIIKPNNPYSLKPLQLPEVNPYMYIKKEYVSFVLLALFVLNSKESETILKKIGIDINGCTTTITIKKPNWAKSKKTNDNNLWGINTKIAVDLFRGLAEIGFLTKKNETEISYEFFGSNMIRDLFQGEFELHANQVLSFLDTLLCDDLLGSITIEWNKTFSLDKLSEGEKQLLLSVGLSLVLNTKNILFLLDEPDVSLHPKWQQEFISNFEKGLDKESMAIITTHSPNIVSDLQNRGLLLLRNGKIVTKSLKYYGKTVDSILGDYFNLASTRNNEVTEKISILWKLIQENKYEDDDFKEKLNNLESIIGADDIEILAMNRDILRKKHEKNK